MTLIQTTRGMMDETRLEKREGVDETENDRCEWVEYWYQGELVHRSVSVQLKRWPEGLGALLSDALTKE